jgi:hypothetical protein
MCLTSRKILFPDFFRLCFNLEKRLILAIKTNFVFVHGNLMKQVWKIITKIYWKYVFKVPFIFTKFCLNDIL